MRQHPRRKNQQPGPNHERWLVSYADFITLLFAFFVVMFATAQTDNAKAQAVSDSVKQALQGESFKRHALHAAGRIGEREDGQGSSPTAGGRRKPSIGDQSGLKLAELLPILAQEAASRDRERPPGRAHELTRPYHQLHPSRAVSFRRR